MDDDKASGREILFDSMWDKFTDAKNRFGLDTAMILLVDLLGLVMLSGGDEKIVEAKADRGVLDAEWQSASEAVLAMIDNWSKVRLSQMKADPLYAPTMERVLENRRRIRESN